ncbi:Putative uncharacterized protein Yba2 [Buchnera aphidicola (Chaitophorus sp. 3695)]|uniref:DUF2076 domain-containing protein n=1 Tax=Buchnera aphidicola TaxID=9 RepID=UPI00346416A6
MNIQEKKLIKDLFKKLNLAEKNSSFKDLEAENFIQKNLKKQPNVIYYMIQTILVQEVAIKKLNNIIKKLENELKTSTPSTSSKKSFLSDLISKYIPNESNEAKNFNSTSRTNHSYYNKNDRPLNQSNENINTSMSGGSSSFLTNALQTAVGVTGGIVAGNMLLNLFDHNKPAEDILNYSDENFVSNEEYPYDSKNNFNEFEDSKNHDNLSDNLENSSEHHHIDQNSIDSDLSNDDNNENIIDSNNSDSILETNEINQDNFSDFSNRDINHQEYFDDEDILDEDYDSE